MTEAERYLGTTPFSTIFSSFYQIVTDDMYLSWTEEETEADLQNILIRAIPNFQFPKFKLYDYDEELAQFNFLLTAEEIKLFADLMQIEWFTRQLATTENIKQIYGSRDFEKTSQANHLDKLIKLRAVTIADNKIKQMSYSRREIDSDGYTQSTFAGLGGKE